MNSVPPLLGTIDPLISEYVAEHGKIPKPNVFYTPRGVNPLPQGWVYKCASCRRYQPGENPAFGLCLAVSEAGEPDPGVIAAESWCAIWENLSTDPIFSWIKRRLTGEPDPWEKVHQTLDDPWEVAASTE